MPAVNITGTAQSVAAATARVTAPLVGSGSMLVRERPPLRLSSLIQSPSSHTQRWAPDERLAQNVLEGLTFSSTMPGGFEAASGTLERNPKGDYPDLAEFSTWTIYGAGGEVAWQGRLETTPRVSGDQIAITPGAVGWQAALSDDQTARMIYVDIDLTKWQGASTQRQINLLASSVDLQPANGSTPDPATGQPAFQTQLTGTWSRYTTSEAWYDANGLPISKLYYAWKAGGGVTGASDTNWDWEANLTTNDVAAGGLFGSGNLRAAGPGTGTLTADPMSTLPLPWAGVSLSYAVAAGAAGTVYSIFWTVLAIYGSHYLPLQGTGTATTAPGLLASDIAVHAVQTWAPELSFSTGGGAQTVQPTSFAIPHLTFPDATTAGEIVKQASRFDLEDWAVWEGPTFWYGPRGTQGNNWQARVGPSGLQEAGPQVDRLYNSVVVQYTDVTGVTRTVGPTGTRSYVTDDSLTDADSTNPVTAAGLTRRALLTLGTSTSAGAIKVGQVFLQQQKLLSTAGQAAIVGHVQDTSGVLWPAWRIRAGDWITFTDAHDPTPRRVVKASYNDDTKTCTVDLDSPPDAMAALLERMQISIKRLGF